MKDRKKKTIMIAVIVVCLIATGLIIFNRRHKGCTTYKGVPIWLKCTNKNCGIDYDMDKVEYLKWVQENMSPTALEAPPMPCKDCNEPSVKPAIKCQQCELVFFMRSVPGDFSDKCPKCGFSKIEQRRKEARQSRDNI